MPIVLTKDGEVEARPNGVFDVRKTCRACDENLTHQVLSLGEQYLVRFPKEIDFSLPKAPLDLYRCDHCGLLQLGHTVKPDLLYRQFWYRTSINQTMRDAMYDIVKHGLEWQDEGSWLDIGANDGYLLSKVPASFSKIAVEPALNLASDLNKVADLTISNYFSAEVVDRKCEVITSAAMFYDLDEPGQFLDDIRETLTPNGIWINQLNDSPTMLKQNAFDALCHEHLCYYDVPTLAKLYARHGLQIVDIRFNDVNGHSVRTVAKRGTGHIAPILGTPEVTLAKAEAFALRTERWKGLMIDFLSGPLSKDPVYCYGASTKGTVLLQYLGEMGNLLAVADKNPDKHGLHMVGSWLPIISEVELRREKPKHLLVLPWAFKNEFVEREAELRANGTTMCFPLPEIAFVL